MNRARVISFFGGSTKSSPVQSPAPTTTMTTTTATPVSQEKSFFAARESPTSTTPRSRPERAASASLRPASMVGAYQPPLMEIAHDTIPELLPIFTFLNSHSNKLYQEGYFLKLNDLDTHGRPLVDRSWTECFSQLVGTVLSLWDAAALDAAGQDGEVAPTFINLADASIKMIETLPTRSQDVQPLSNVLSISTAGKNRYLFHFSNINALTQWTAGIRLAMYEHATLQEAYTGSLVGGKGKSLNNIKAIMDRTVIKSEDWARVRFGAGTPWRRCWCVVSPPDPKEVSKAQKLLKKKSAYDRTMPVMKGDIKFYDTRKTKKVQPIATIQDAYSAYAIYPQSKPLIDQSTLVKIEGIITIHSKPETTTEGFIFVMPESHPAVTGFEIMLRFLFPVYDIFNLYGRPSRLIADTIDPRSLMFAMPTERRYGYLEIFDVATLIHADGAQSWTEREWRKQLKTLTSQRIAKISASGSRAGSRMGSRAGHRNSMPSRTGGLRFADAASMASTPNLHSNVTFQPPPHTGSVLPGVGPLQLSKNSLHHQRSISETTPFSTPRRRGTMPEQGANYNPSSLSYETNNARESIDEEAPPPPVHGVPSPAYKNPQVQRHAGDYDGVNERSSSDSERRYKTPPEPAIQAQSIQHGLLPNAPPSPVAAPPAFSHQPGDVPQQRPYGAPELRRANSRMSSTTLSQLAAAGGNNPAAGAVAGFAAAGAAAAWRGNNPQREGTYEDQGQGRVNNYNSTSINSMSADQASRNEELVLANAGGSGSNDQQQVESLSPDNRHLPPPYASETLSGSLGLRAPSTNSPRNVSPLSQSSTHTYFTSEQDQDEPLPVVRNFSRQNSFPSNKASTSPTRSAPSLPTEAERPSNLNRLSTHSITRKPVPASTSEPYPTTLERPSVESLRRHVVDEAAINRINTMKSYASSNGATESRRLSADSSHYDTDSAVSPDHLVPSNSLNALRSPIDKPRTGILKTVGRPDPSENDVVIGDVRYRSDNQQTNNPDIPNIDFGPTHVYRPESQQELVRPKSSDRLAGHSHTRSGSSDRLVGQAHARSGSSDRFTPSPQLDGSQAMYEKDNNQSTVNPHGRTQSRNAVTPEPNNYRSTSAQSSNENRRSMLWQPGAATAGSPEGKQTITPEQFVQQRAAASRTTPVYAHGRNTSGTPPLNARNSSGDWTGQTRQDAPVRPQSRNTSATVMAMTTNAPDYSAHLSAREQEHVARVTGSPLINMAGSNSRPPAPGSGLVGAIEAREREKKEMKKGVSGQMVQNAITQRQQQSQKQTQQQTQQQQQQQQLLLQQQQQQQYQQQAQYRQPQPSPQYHMPGQYPQTPQSANFGQQYSQSQQMEQQQQQWMQPQQSYGNTHPSAQAYWGASLGPGPSNSRSGSNSPVPQQGQYGVGQYSGQQSQYGTQSQYGPLGPQGQQSQYAQQGQQPQGQQSQYGPQQGQQRQQGQYQGQYQGQGYFDNRQGGR